LKYTQNYNLKKPEGTDLVNIDDLNYNADVIDSQLKTNADTITQHITDPAPHSGHETPAGAQAKAEAAAGAVRAELDAHKADYANPHQVKAEQVFALGGVPAGTTFPTSPAPYTLFFRTDLNKLFVYLP